MHQHQVQFYDSEAFLLSTIREFIEPAQDAAEGWIVIATGEHCAALRSSVAALGNPAPRDGPDPFLLLDARETLATFMVDGQPDAERFATVLGSLVHQVSAGGTRPVRVFGEMVAVLYADGMPDAALELESLWDPFVRQHGLSLLCAYPMSSFPDDTHRRAFQCVCDAHTGVRLIEGVCGGTDGVDDLHRMLARLRQEANALEAEAQKHRDADLVVHLQRDRIRAMERVLVEMETLAGHDDLTGLPNRRLFTDRLTHAVRRARRESRSLALVYIDLDGLKAVNDGHGHLVGDAVLQAVAVRLLACVRAADTLCRLGGDEFVVLIEETDVQRSLEWVGRARAALEEPYRIGDATVSAPASFGVAMYPEHAQDAQALVRAADLAMYREKVARKATAGLGPDDAAQALMLPSMLTVEAAATHLRLSRPHVMQLIADKHLRHVVHSHGTLPMIPASEVTRVARETRRRFAD